MQVTVTYKLYCRVGRIQNQDMKRLLWKWHEDVQQRRFCRDVHRSGLNSNFIY